MGTPRVPHWGEQLLPPAVRVQLMDLAFPVSPEMEAGMEIGAPPVRATSSLAPLLILRFPCGGKPRNRLKMPIAALLKLETARIIGRSYGGLGRDAGGVKVKARRVKGIPVVPLVVVPVVMAPGVRVPQTVPPPLAGQA